MKNVLPPEDQVRKAAPMYRGLLAFFPWALFKVAAHSFRSDRKHNPDRPEAEAPRWAREKSTDHADCILRHLAEAHTDPDYHYAALAWRALALLQEHGEAKHGAAPGAHSVFPEAEPETWIVEYYGSEGVTRSQDVPEEYSSYATAMAAIVAGLPGMSNRAYWVPRRVS